MHPVLPDGSLGVRSDLVQHAGSGPDPERQAGPHAHMAIFVADDLLLAADLGVDGVAAYRLDPATGRLSPAPTPWSTLPAGFGPRHLVVLPENWSRVAGELTGEIALLRLDPATGGLTLVDRERASDRRDAVLRPAASTAPPTAGSWSSPTVGPTPWPASRSSTRCTPHTSGRWTRSVAAETHPRAITVIDDLIYVANQDSDNITVLRIDGRPAR